MMKHQWIFWITSCLIIQALITFSAYYAYRINTKRAPGDSEKREYARYAPWLAPIVMPLLVLFNIPLFILSSLAFGLFLVLFPFLLLLFRKPFLIKWILKQTLKVGNSILSINTELLKLIGFHPVTFKTNI